MMTANIAIPFKEASMAPSKDSSKNSHGMIAVDKIGTKVLFLNPQSFATEVVIDGFPRTVHELLVVPQSQSAASPLRLRSTQARPCRYDRSAPLYRAAYAQAWTRWIYLHYLREFG